MDECSIEGESQTLGPGGDAECQLKKQSSPVKDTKLSVERVLGKESPAKPQEDAIEPDEDAQSKVGSEGSAESMSTRDLDSPLTVTSVTPSEMSLTSVTPSEMLTSEVLQEQKNVEEKVEAEKDETELDKRKQLWAHMDMETKEHRYRRLKCLLMKSNMYTQYLLGRMETQREEEKKRRERILRRQAKLKAAQEAGIAAGGEGSTQGEEEVKAEIASGGEGSTQGEEVKLEKVAGGEGSKQGEEMEAETNAHVDQASTSGGTTPEPAVEVSEKPTTTNSVEVMSSPKLVSSQSSSARSTPTRSTKARTSLRAPVPKSRLSAANSPALGNVQSPANSPLARDVGQRSVKLAKSGTDDTSLSESVVNADSNASQDRGVAETEGGVSAVGVASVEEPMMCDGQEKENTPVRTRRSLRIMASPAGVEKQDLSSPRGKKRKQKDTEDQSPHPAQPLTNFFKPVPKKRKVDAEEVSDEESSTEDVKPDEDDPKDAKTVKKPKDKPPPVLFEGEPEIDVDGSILKPALFTGGELRPYQVEGLNWLKILFENGVNGILADEMGLGKTIQCIAVITQIVTMGASGPFMVVAPLSTLPNWKSEFKRFAPHLPVVFYHGLKHERALIRKKIRKRHHIMKNVNIRPVVITSFEMAMIDRPHLREFDWTYMIVDEGHRIKNKDCRLIRELKLYKNSHRILLTGTPLQNSLRELWSLLNFLLPDIFDDLGSFETWFDVEVISDQDADEAIIQAEKKENILGMLHQILTPFMLRRVKTDVDLNIPPKKELLVYAPLTCFQQEFYESTVDRTILQKLEAKNTPKEEVEISSTGRPKRWATKKKVNYNLMMESSGDSVVPANKRKDEEELESWVEAIMENSKPMQKKAKTKVSQVTVRLQNIMMQLRKCCNHPYLLEYPLDPATGDYKMDEELIKKCGKMMLLDKMLEELKDRGHKVLLFSQMTKMLDILEDFCYLRKYEYCRLDGSCGVDDRQESMESFNKDPNKFLFLLSTRAGGLGINLTGADTVIIYDSDWNPQNDLQAQDRCHRIGQTKPVVVYRLVTANTIDQKIVERAAAKRKLEKMIIHKGKFKSGIRNFSTEMKPLCPEELMQLLKSRDYKSTEQQGNDYSVISKEDLLALLDRSDLQEQFESIQRGEKPTKGSSTDGEFKTSAKESSKLFSMVDYDAGGSTLEKKDHGETTVADS